MAAIRIEDIQRDVIAYIHRVAAGETLVILEDGKAVAELKPAAVAVQTRPYGLCAGEFSVPNGFDNPLPQSILDDFEN